MTLLKLFVLTTHNFNKRYLSLTEQGAEKEEVKELTNELGNIAAQYNQNIGKLWDILTNFQHSEKSIRQKI